MDIGLREAEASFVLVEVGPAVESEIRPRLLFLSFNLHRALSRICRVVQMEPVEHLGRWEEAELWAQLAVDSMEDFVDLKVN